MARKVVINQSLMVVPADGTCLGTRVVNKFKGRNAMGRWGLGILPGEMPSRLVYTKVTIDGVTVRM